MTESMRPDWYDDAACRGRPTNVWFSANSGDVATAKRVCAECPTRQLCLEHALDHREDEGLWGGLTTPERHRLQRRNRYWLAKQERSA